MLKKILMTCSVFIIGSNVVWADVTPYVGGGLGWQNHWDHNGMIGNLFGGVGTKLGPCQRYYLGGELFGDVSLLSRTHNSGAVWGFGASAIPGLMINPSTMIYGRAGVETDIRDFHYHHKNHWNTSTGVQLGAGLQTSLTKSWDMRAEYVSNLAWSNNNRVNLGFVYKFK